MADGNDYLALEERIGSIEKSVEELVEGLKPEKLGEAIAKALPGDDPAKTEPEGDEGKPELGDVVKSAVEDATKDLSEKVAKLDGKVEALGAGGTAQPNSRQPVAKGSEEHAGIL